MRAREVVCSRLPGRQWVRLSCLPWTNTHDRDYLPTINPSFTIPLSHQHIFVESTYCFRSDSNSETHVFQGLLPSWFNHWEAKGVLKFRFSHWWIHNSMELFGGDRILWGWGLLRRSGSMGICPWGYFLLPRRYFWTLSVPLRCSHEVQSCASHTLASQCSASSETMKPTNQGLEPLNCKPR